MAFKFRIIAQAFFVLSIGNDVYKRNYLRFGFATLSIGIWSKLLYNRLYWNSKCSDLKPCVETKVIEAGESNLNHLEIHEVC